MPSDTADDDDLPFDEIFTKPRRRRSSMLDKWIDDQHKHNSTAGYTDPDHDVDDPATPSGTRSNPYLAYPDLAGRILDAQSSTLTIESYDLLDDEDIPDTTPHSTLNRPPRPSTLNFHGVSLPFHSPSTPKSSPITSKSPPRMLFFGSGRNSSHNRSASLGTLNIPRPSSKWRPTVMGYFGSPSASQTSVLPPSEPVYIPPRPSISSSNTCTSSTSPSKQHISATPSKLSLVDSLRSRRRSYGVNILRSGSETLPSMSTLCLDDETSRSSSPTPHSTRVPFGPKPPSRLGNVSVNSDQDDDQELHGRGLAQPHVSFSAPRDSSLSRVHFASRNEKRKKKLVISGIGLDEKKRYEAAKRWCESFGELNQIIQMPNGDLHVHFRSADVADTVCRLRAKVFIGGVGSVNLSWYTGTRR